MGIPVAYGHKSDIASAIRQCKIPKECIIITNDSAESAEMFFYDNKGVLKSISGESYDRLIINGGTSDG